MQFSVSSLGGTRTLWLDGQMFAVLKSCAVMWTLLSAVSPSVLLLVILNLKKGLFSTLWAVLEVSWVFLERLM